MGAMKCSERLKVTGGLLTTSPIQCQSFENLGLVCNPEYASLIVFLTLLARKFYFELEIDLSLTIAKLGFETAIEGNT